MQSLVLGATGLVGRHIVNRLVAAGEHPFALSRSSQADARIRWFVGNLENASALTFPPFQTLYCTVHCYLLATALPSLAHSGLQRVVFFTSTSILTKLSSAIALERAQIHLLANSEQRAIAECEKHGIAWTVLRPTIIYDEGHDPNISRLARLIEKFGFFPLAGFGKGLRQPVHAEDLAIGALQTAASEAAINKIYNVPGAETVTYREMIGRIFDGLDRPRRIIPLPPILWRAAFHIARRYFPNANAEMGRRMSKDMIFDASAAAQDFGWSPRPFHPRFDRTERSARASR
ncbi:MAG: NAD-dependent epimerase/dehydratase family protein [Afipia sp.]